MALVYRTCKTKYAPLDGTGPRERGGRWSSPGRAAVYASTSYANTLLEILVHRGRVRLPGAHHVAEIEIPESLVEYVGPTDVRGWDEPESPAARDYGDAWLAAGRSVAIVVPAVVARPFERNVVINPAHPAFAQVRERRREPVGWDKRLFAG